MIFSPNETKFINYYVLHYGIVPTNDCQFEPNSFLNYYILHYNIVRTLSVKINWFTYSNLVCYFWHTNIKIIDSLFVRESSK